MLHAKRVVLGAVILLAVACASEKNNTVTLENGEVVTPVAAESYLNHKSLEIQRLERRVSDLNAIAADENRKYRGSHENLELLIAQQFEKLGGAKADWQTLKEAKGAYTVKLMTRLNDSLDDMRTTLNLMVAE